MCPNLLAHNRLAICLTTLSILWTFWATSVCSAQSNGIRLAREHIESGRFSSAVPVLESLLADSTLHVEAQLLLLRIRQDSYLRHKEKARALARSLETLEEHDLIVFGRSVSAEIRLRALQLTTSPRASMSLLDRRRQNTAEEILKSDFGNPLALLEKSTEARFLGDALRAELYAQTALDNDPLSHRAYVELFRYAAERGEAERLDSLATRLKHAIPESPYGWLMMGYADASRRNFESAELNFQIALEHMSSKARRAYINATSLIKQDVAGEVGMDSLAYSLNYWTQQDPLYLSASNERRIEHFARHAYADMMFADHYEDWTGWETDRGRFFIRYGAPDHVQRETRLEDDPSEYDERMYELTGDERQLIAREVSTGAAKTEFRFEYWLYDSTIWHFYDSWWTDTYIHYSPPANSFMRARGIQARDDVIEANNWAFKEPFRTAITLPGAQLPLTYVASRFRPEGFDNLFSQSDSMDVVVARGIPVPFRPRSGPLNAPVRIGTFLAGIRNGMAAKHIEEFQTREAADITKIDNTLFWRYVGTISAPSSDSYQLSVEYQTLPSKAIWGVQREQLEPLEPSTDGPGMSDLLLASSVDEAIPRIGNTDSNAQTI